MLYHAYELQRAWLGGASAWASIAAEMLMALINGSEPEMRRQLLPTHLSLRGSERP